MKRIGLRILILIGLMVSAFAVWQARRQSTGTLAAAQGHQAQGKKFEPKQLSSSFEGSVNDFTNEMEVSYLNEVEVQAAPLLEPLSDVAGTELSRVALRIEEQAYAGGDLAAQAQRNVARMLESGSAVEILVAIDLLKHFPMAPATFKDDVALAICRWQNRPEEFELIRAKFERAARSLGYPSLNRCEG